MKKKIISWLKKVSIIAMKVSSIFIGSIGGVSIVMFLVFMVYLLITETHAWVFVIPDSTRLFGLGWMNISGLLTIVGVVGFLESDKRLKKLKCKS